MAHRRRRSEVDELTRILSAVKSEQVSFRSVSASTPRRAEMSSAWEAVIAGIVSGTTLATVSYALTHSVALSLVIGGLVALALFWTRLLSLDQSRRVEVRAELDEHDIAEPTTDTFVPDDDNPRTLMRHPIMAKLRRFGEQLPSTNHRLAFRQWEGKLFTREEYQAVRAMMQHLNYEDPNGRVTERGKSAAGRWSAGRFRNAEISTIPRDARNHTNGT